MHKLHLMKRRPPVVVVKMDIIDDDDNDDDDIICNLSNCNERDWLTICISEMLDIECWIIEFMGNGEKLKLDKL